MGKGAVGMVAGYWPEDVYRYLAIPSIYLDEALVARPAKRFPDKVAIEFDSHRLTYQQLATEADKAMKAVLSLTEGKNLRLALLGYNPLEFLPTFIGLLRAHCLVLLPDMSASADSWLQQIAAFGPDLVITDGKMGSQPPSWGEKIKIISLPELLQLPVTVAPAPKRLDMKGPCIAMVGRGGQIFYHSHNSALAGAISWSAFVPLKEEDVVLNVQPLYTWEGLFGLLPTLFKGATCLMGSLEDPEKLATAIISHHCSYTWLTLEQARRLWNHPHSNLVGAIRQNLLGVFISVSGSFRPRNRRQLRYLLGDVPVLTVFGFPEAGPVLASHPTWYLNEAVGIPVSNVDVWPLNPDTGNPLLVPWEAIEYAEIGIKSPMTAIKFHSPEEEQAQIREGWLRGQVVTSMDPNGLFYFRPEFSLKSERGALIPALRAPFTE